MGIRNYHESDHNRVMEIYGQSKLDELKFEVEDFDFLALEKDGMRYTQFIDSDIYVYEDLDIVGYGVHFGAEIRALFVHPSMRGKGIGVTLLEHLLSKIHGPASLYIAASNYPAKKLYQKYGFKVVDEFETTYNGTRVMANKMIQLA